MQVPEQQSPRTTTDVIGKLSRAGHNVFAARFDHVLEVAQLMVFGWMRLVLAG
jgi:hypothetical protein